MFVDFGEEKSLKVSSINTLAKISFNEDILITDPMYIIRSDKIENVETKPNRKDYYPTTWNFDEPIDIDSPNFDISLDCEHRYQKAWQAWQEDNLSEWDLCNYGDNLKILGLKHFYVGNTIYGPWGCRIYDRRTKKELGRFCSDSGLFGIFSLSEVMNYNPNYSKHRSQPWTSTIIPNFRGEIQVVNFGGNEPGSSDIRVVGIGSINFYSKQTDF